MVARTIRLRPGIVDRLKAVRGLSSDESVARLIGVDRTTLYRIAVQETAPSPAFQAEFCAAFGLGLGEAFEIVERNEAEAAA